MSNYLIKWREVSLNYVLCALSLMSFVLLPYMITCRCNNRVSRIAAFLYMKYSTCLVCFCMLTLLLLLYLHNLWFFSPKIYSFLIQFFLASNKCYVFLTSFSLLRYLFVCLFVTIIIIIRHELGLDRSASACSNSLFKGFHKSSSSIWPIIQRYF